MMSNFSKLPLEYSTQKSLKIYGVRFLIFFTPTILLFLLFISLTIIDTETSNIDQLMLVNIISFSVATSIFAFTLSRLPFLAYKTTKINLSANNKNTKIKITFVPRNDEDLSEIISQTKNIEKILDDNYPLMLKDIEIENIIDSTLDN